MQLRRVPNYRANADTAVVEMRSCLVLPVVTATKSTMILHMKAGRKTEVDIYIASDFSRSIVVTD
jgi:hypothetical protein